MTVSGSIPRTASPTECFYKQLPGEHVRQRIMSVALKDGFCPMCYRCYDRFYGNKIKKTNKNPEPLSRSDYSSQKVLEILQNIPSRRKVPKSGFPALPEGSVQDPPEEPQPDSAPRNKRRKPGGDL